MELGSVLLEISINNCGAETQELEIIDAISI